jgi:quercetin dioxygenase-like cupin family protein
MSVSRIRISSAAAVLCALAIGSQLAWTQDPAHASHAGKTERARVAAFRDLPTLNGNRLKVTLVEVNYGPGESSPPHSHPCPVVGYVVSGAIRTQVKGDVLRTSERRSRCLG